MTSSMVMVCRAVLLLVTAAQVSSAGSQVSSYSSLSSGISALRAPSSVGSLGSAHGFSSIRGLAQNSNFGINKGVASAFGNARVSTGSRNSIFNNGHSSAGVRGFSNRKVASNQGRNRGTGQGLVSIFGNKNTNSPSNTRQSSIFNSGHAAGNNVGFNNRANSIFSSRGQSTSFNKGSTAGASSRLSNSPIFNRRPTNTKPSVGLGNSLFSPSNSRKNSGSNFNLNSSFNNRRSQASNFGRSAGSTFGSSSSFNRRGNRNQIKNNNFGGLNRQRGSSLFSTGKKVELHPTKTGLYADGANFRFVQYPSGAVRSGQQAGGSVGVFSRQSSRSGFGSHGKARGSFLSSGNRAVNLGLPSRTFTGGRQYVD